MLILCLVAAKPRNALRSASLLTCFGPASLSSSVRQPPMLSRSPELKRRIEVAEKLQRRPGFSRFPLLHDPIEDQEPTASLIKRAGERARAAVDRKIRMGRCHAVWKKMKEILQTEHGIEWYSPAEMNPGVRFD